jgi:hypothetical protein
MRGGRFSRIVGSLGGGSGGGDSLTAGNILNGVLDCKWNKTSAVPSLLEIYNTSFVKFNIDALTPLVLRFADGWDDNDQPKGVVKKLAIAPSNIDLSGKANCHVQIVAKVINDEITITTHDIYDPAVGYGSNILPDFSSGRGGTNWEPTKNGWSLYADNQTGDYYPWKAADRSLSNYAYVITYWTAVPPFPLCVSLFGVYPDSVKSFKWQGRLPIEQTWEDITSNTTVPTKNSWYHTPVLTTKLGTCYDAIRWVATGGSFNPREVEIYEQPTAKFFRGLNKVKDRTDTEVYWVNLGYATMDANGAITALNHYTDLRNNYPGGMRVEA